MRKLILVAHVSLDGFVADVNGAFDNFSDPDESLKFVCKIIDDADAALFGKNSYELINSHWPTAAQNPVLLFICVKRIPCLTKLLKRIILKAHRFLS
ncbi:MAG TPA: hypothetical protein PK289_11565 [Bacteroidia bacterium]|jgi:dihydrofolate reductase|nr:hypothetical protein [Bacteroidia bacterium]HRG53950.1 hypothetical protein [Bacteroidia bacterium]